MNLATKTVHGVGWSGISQVIRFILSFGVTSILAHLLSPSDFGTMAMIFVFTNIIANFYDMGLGAALIQKKDVDDSHLSTSFWINIIIGLCLSLILIVASPLIGIFYNNGKLIVFIIPIALTFFIMSIGVVQYALLVKHLEFKVIALIEILSTFISGLCAIVLAIMRLGVWSLVGQAVTYSFINSLLLWLLTKWRPKFIFRLDKVKYLLIYGLNLTGANIVTYFRRNMDNLLIGKYLGATLLGYYALSYNLLLFPLNNITYVVNRVMFPSLSQIQEDKKAIGGAYIKANRFIAIITFPLMTILFILAPEFIRVFFGEQWARTILLIRIFALIGITQSISSTAGCLFQVVGRTDTLFKWGVACAIINIVGFIIGIRWSVEGVAIAFTITEILLVFPTFKIAFRYIDLGMIDFMKQFIKISIATVVMGVLLWGLKLFFVYFHLWDIIVLFSGTIIAAPIYILLIYLLERKILVELTQYTMSFIQGIKISET